MKSYRVRMTEGVEMIVHHERDEGGSDFFEVVEAALASSVFVQVEPSSPGGERIAINPRHVLCVREVAE